MPRTITHPNHRDIRNLVFTNDVHALTELLERNKHIPGFMEAIELGFRDDRQRSTLLHVAADCGSTAVCRLLLKQGADVNAKSQLGWTPLLCAVRSGMTDCVEILLNATKDNEDKAPYGEALILASKQGDMEAVRLLLDAGADPNSWDANGNTPLHHAIHKQHPAIANLLMEAGADVNAANWGEKEKETPAHLAAALPQAATLRRLIKRGAEVNVNDARGRTPLHVCARNPNHDDEYYRREHDWPDRERMKRRTYGSIDEVAALLIGVAIEVDAKDRDGMTAMHWAMQANNAALVRCLIDAGADYNITDDGGNTPLHSAYSNKCIKLLLAQGPHVNARNDAGTTPLQEFVASRGSMEGAQALLDAGALVDSRDKDGRTALHYLIELTHPVTGRRAPGDVDPALLRCLLAAGADPLARNNDGRTPRDILKENFRHHRDYSDLRDKLAAAEAAADPAVRPPLQPGPSKLSQTA